MKKFLYVALMTFVMIGMSACSKDKDLTGTKWVATITETDPEIGIPLTMTMTLSFTSETEGTLTMSAMGFTETENFTYTYDGDGKGTMTGKDENGAASTIDFTIDDDKLTITEEGETIVFTKQ